MSAVIVPIVTAVLPYLPGLITDIKNLFTKYPQLTPAQIAAAVSVLTSQSDAEFADALETLNAALPPASPAAVTPAVVHP